MWKTIRFIREHVAQIGIEQIGCMIAAIFVVYSMTLAVVLD